MKEFPIRVVQILENMDNGGVETVVMNYYRNIDHSKIQFDFIVSENSSIPQKEEILKMGGRIYTVPSYKKIFKYMKALKQIFQNNNYTIVHSHLNTMSVFPLYVAKKCNIKIRISHSHTQANYQEFLKSLLKEILRHFSKIFSNVYFACSKEAAIYQFGKKSVLNDKVYILNNAIDNDNFKFDITKRNEMRKKYNIDEDTQVYFHVGRFEKQKNHIFLIKIFQKIHLKNNNTKLVLVGNGKELNNIKNLVYRLGLSDSVIFTGSVENPADYYFMADVFYFPSLYEGLGMVLIEAQCSGLQCVASTNVPKSSKISDLVTYIPLTDEEGWINYNIKKVNREDYKNILSLANYDIKIEAKKLEDKYLELINRG